MSSKINLFLSYHFNGSEIHHRFTIFTSTRPSALLLSQPVMQIPSLATQLLLHPPGQLWIVRYSLWEGLCTYLSSFYSVFLMGVFKKKPSIQFHILPLDLRLDILRHFLATSTPKKFIDWKEKKTDFLQFLSLSETQIDVIEISMFSNQTWHCICKIL